MIFEWILKGVVLAVLTLLDLLGWKRAVKWVDAWVSEHEKDEKPVV